MLPKESKVVVLFSLSANQEFLVLSGFILVK